MWTYDSVIGTMHICPDHNTGKYILVINDNAYGAYLSPVAAADDVYTFTTGCSDWDELDGDIEMMCSAPTDLSEWENH